MWKAYKPACTRGSEGGVVLADEEYEGACRITLERCPRYDAITCGVYGAMVHTVFRDPANSRAVYEAMKAELADFCGGDTTEEEEYAFYRRFRERYT